MSFFTLSNGEKLYYEDEGSGQETVVMMHGWSSSCEIYERSFETLKEKVRCIIYDHRGHGGSKDANREKPTMDTLAGDLKELIDGLGLDNITLLGWSMGAGVALTYIRLYGCDGLKRLILCDMTPKMLNDDEWKLGMYQGKYTRKDMEDDAGKDFFSLYKTFALAAVPSLKKYPDIVIKRPLKEKLSSCDESVLTSLAVSMKIQDNRETLERVTVPVFYFYAEPGSLFSPDLADWYREHVKTPFNAVPFPDSDHMLVSNYPDKFAGEVEATFL